MNYCTAAREEEQEVSQMRKGVGFLTDTVTSYLRGAGRPGEMRTYVHKKIQNAQTLRYSKTWYTQICMHMRTDTHKHMCTLTHKHVHEDRHMQRQQFDV